MDPKEQVINLELTAYGRYLLSIGKLNPSFYAFFDDDIIYDSLAANINNEPQSEIEPRIQEQTPRMTAQPVYSGRDIAIFNKNPNVVNDLIIGAEFLTEDSIFEAPVERGELILLDGPEKTEILQQPLAVYDPSTGFAPAWNAAFLKAKLSSSLDYTSITGSRGEKILNIPQLNSNIEYEIIRNNNKYNKTYPEKINQTTDPFFLDELNFNNGDVVRTFKDALIIRLEESNIFYGKENFEVEVFEISDVEIKNPNGETSIEEFLLPIDFYKNRDQLFSDNLDDAVDKQTVDYLFDFLVDSEIDERIICPIISEDDTKQIYNTKIFNCEGVNGSIEIENVYLDEDDTRDVCD
tara:strand:+ start:37 stop:1089 length:1053 start_codon:yes stop_codon:yes gene_type:complete